MKHTAYVAFGANLHGPKQQCEHALQLLSQAPHVELVKASPWFRSPALTTNHEVQPDYCNGVARFHTTLEARDFFQLLKKIETKMGRPEKHEKWAPRVIDVDLLFFDQLILTTDELTLPHPELTKRLFVLQPLCEIAPDVQDPRSGKKFSLFRDELLKKEKILNLWK